MFSLDGAPIKQVNGPEAFKKIALIGKGDVGKVYLVQNLVNNKYYAMKVTAKCPMWFVPFAMHGAFGNTHYTISITRKSEKNNWCTRTHGMERQQQSHSHNM